MDNNNNTIKLSKKEYYKNYQNQHRDKIREINRRFYQNKISDANFKLELNKKTLQNRHNRLIRNGLEIKPRGRPRKNE
jgi:hypothetical protein